MARLTPGQLLTVTTTLSTILSLGMHMYGVPYLDSLKPEATVASILFAFAVTCRINHYFTESMEPDSGITAAGVIAIVLTIVMMIMQYVWIYALVLCDSIFQLFVTMQEDYLRDTMPDIYYWLRNESYQVWTFVLAFIGAFYCLDSKLLRHLLFWRLYTSPSSLDHLSTEDQILVRLLMRDDENIRTTHTTPNYISRILPRVPQDNIMRLVQLVEEAKLHSTRSRMNIFGSNTSIAVDDILADHGSPYMYRPVSRTRSRPRSRPRSRGRSRSRSPGRSRTQPRPRTQSRSNNNTSSSTTSGNRSRHRNRNRNRSNSQNRNRSRTRYTR